MYSEQERQRKLEEVAAEAHTAEECGDDWAANEAWRRYELIRDGGRPPSELLAEAIALSEQTSELAEAARR